MLITLRRDLGGYALKTLIEADVDGTELTKPFVLLTGPNGSGKSALLRAMRASIGLRGERGGSTDTPMARHPDPGTVTDPAILATHDLEYGEGCTPARHVPAVLDVHDLGWTGQPTHLFDSRAAGSIGQSDAFDDDMAFNVSMVVGGGRNASHGEFVSKVWWEALEWAVGNHDVPDPWTKGGASPARLAAHAAFIGDAEPSTERWLFIDEPETAIDAEKLLVGLCILLEAAKIGGLRVICASHSLLFAAGLAGHAKVQTVDLGPGGSWLDTQRIALNVAADRTKTTSVGKDMLRKLRGKKKR